MLKSKLIRFYHYVEPDYGQERSYEILAAEILYKVLPGTYGAQSVCKYSEVRPCEVQNARKAFCRLLALYLQHPFVHFVNPKLHSAA